MNDYDSNNYEANDVYHGGYVFDNNAESLEVYAWIGNPSVAVWTGDYYEVDRLPVTFVERLSN